MLGRIRTVVSSRARPRRRVRAGGLARRGGGRRGRAELAEGDGVAAGFGEEVALAEHVGPAATGSRPGAAELPGGGDQLPVGAGQRRCRCQTGPQPWEGRPGPVRLLVAYLAM